MISAAQVIRRADTEGVPARTIERDYVLAQVLQAIAALDDERLVFKGGTALRFCFLESSRYSADLDFSIVGGSTDDGREVVAKALARLRREDVFEVIELDDSVPARIVFVGPLESERRIKLDLADDELVIECVRTLLLVRWGELPSGVRINSYTPTEIAGEKLRRVIQRLQCRDLFDLDALFGELMVDPVEAAERFRAKAVHRGLDPDLFAERWGQRVEDYKQRWQPELSEHMAAVPHFEAVERRVARHLRRARLI